MELATSRFHARELIDISELAPVSIAVGQPKWPLGYELAGRVDRLCPWGLLGADDWAERYQRRLEHLDPKLVVHELEGLAAAHSRPGVVLLCWEPAGEPCHRRIVAEWFEQELGIEVPELQPP
jgi:hypothetical protein